MKRIPAGGDNQITRVRDTTIRLKECRNEEIICKRVHVDVRRDAKVQEFETRQVEKLHAVHVRFGDPAPQTGRRAMETVEGSEFEVDADLVLLALGFLGPVREGLLEQLGVALTDRGNVATTEFATSVPGVFAAGDMRRGQSLVVWAIAEGRRAAEEIDRFLRT